MDVITLAKAKKQAEEIVRKEIKDSGASNFIVNITESTDEDGNEIITADKTYAEILEAYNNRIFPVCIYGNHVIPMISIGDTDCCFKRVYHTLEGVFAEYIYIYPSGWIFVGESEFSIDKIANKKTINELETTEKTLTGAINELNSMKLTAPETAEVGQTIVVEEIDENGKPTKWKCADLSSGIELIYNHDGEVPISIECNGVTADYANGIYTNATLFDFLKANWKSPVFITQTGGFEAYYFGYISVISSNRIYIYFNNSKMTITRE